MSDSELPDTQQDRVDWVIRAPDNQEMRRRYDIWAEKYDADVGSIEDYLAPIETVKVAAEHMPATARIMDAGAGTGLVGQALKDNGFQDITAVDYSAPMLEIARAKSLYSEIHQCDLSQPTKFETGSFDGIVSCGTTSQMPSVSLREFNRILCPSGKIVFASVPEPWQENGWAALLAEFEASGNLSLVSRGKPFQMMPTTEPQFMCEVLVIQKH